MRGRGQGGFAEDQSVRVAVSCPRVGGEWTSDIAFQLLWRWSPRPRCQQHQVMALGLVGTFPLGPHLVGEGPAPTTPCPNDIITFQRPYLPTASPWGAGISTQEFGEGHKYSRTPWGVSLTGDWRDGRMESCIFQLMGGPCLPWGPSPESSVWPCAQGPASVRNQAGQVSQGGAGRSGEGRLGLGVQCPSSSVVVLLLHSMLNGSVVSDSLRSQGLWPSRLLCPWGFSRQEYLALLQGIFPTRVWTGVLCLLHWQAGSFTMWALPGKLLQGISSSLLYEVLRLVVWAVAALK